MTTWSTRAGIADQARALGLAGGDTVMVHASLRAVGPVLGGADALLDGLLDACAPGGTLMMYLACQSPWDDIGCGKLPPDEEDLARAHLPPFDATTARANPSHGVLAELFRTRAGCRVSANPGARMAALGTQVERLVADHPQAWDYGPGSPLARLVETGGKVLLLGSDHDQVTLLHHAEHLAPIPDKRVVTLEVPMQEAGRRVWKRFMEFDTSRGIVDWPDRFFATIVDGFAATRCGPVGGADALLLDAAALVDHAVAVMVATVR